MIDGQNMDNVLDHLKWTVSMGEILSLPFFFSTEELSFYVYIGF